MSPGVNMLTKSLKISDTTKTEFSELISFKSDQKTLQDKCPADLFKQSFGRFKMLTIHKCSRRGLFSNLSNPAFCSL